MNGMNAGVKVQPPTATMRPFPQHPHRCTNARRDSTASTTNLPAQAILDVMRTTALAILSCAPLVGALLGCAGSAPHAVRVGLVRAVGAGLVQQAELERDECGPEVDEVPPPKPDDAPRFHPPR